MVFIQKGGETMSYDPFANKFLSFPSIPLPSIWNDEDTWLTNSQTPSGVSISEDEKNIYIETALPGINPENIDITYENGYVWIKGEAREEEEE